MGKAIGYLRKSRVSSDRHVSWEVQERQVRAEAAHHGDADLELLSDWGKSGRSERMHRRTEYLRLRSMIESGEVSRLYSYSLSRLARSVGEYASLAELCKDHGVTVRLCKEGEQNYSTAAGRFYVNMLASLAQMEAELAQERAADTIAARRARGDDVGSAGYGFRLNGGKKEAHPGEHLEDVLAAFRDKGSYHGAAKSLNALGITTRTKSAKWSATSVARIIRRELKEVDAAVATTKTRGAKAKSDFALGRLLRCPCGGLMTGRKEVRTTKYGTFGPYISYQCFLGRSDLSHVRPYMVSERLILPWVRLEVARLRVPDSVIVGDTATRAEREDLEAQRALIGDALVMRAYNREQAANKVSAIDAQLDQLDARSRVEALPPEVDWDASPQTLNTVLRAIFEHIQLGSDLRPVEAIWRVPEWRSDKP